MTDQEKWSTNANEAIKIRLLHLSGSKSKDKTFAPEFTYPIFGEEETIFGHEGLRIRLDFAAHTLHPSLHVSSQQTIEPAEDTKADDVEEILREFMPEVVEGAEDQEADEAAFSPPGELLHQYEVGGRSYGIWCANLADPGAKRLLRNVQILVLFFIEGASMIELNDPDWTIERWTIFFIYEIEPSPNNPNITAYNLVGYSTSYKLFFLDIPSGTSITQSNDLPPEDTSLTSKIPCRERISQFLILPPYQSAGHGSHLYNTMIARFISIPQIRTITVEDPNERFDDLRDYSDLIHLRASSAAFRDITLNSSTKLPASRSQPLPVASLLAPDVLEPIVTSSRIAPRQFARLLEMQLLSKIPERHRQAARITRKDKASDPNDRAYYFWRLIVKQRLYKHNLDQLAQLELEERIDKLEETVASVENDYVRLLDEVDRRVEKWGGLEEVPVESGDADTKKATPNRGRKRRVVNDDEEEEDLETRTSGARANGGRKRTKVEVVEVD